MIKLDDDDYKDKIVEVDKNKRFTIILDSNPTTGYRWEIKFEKSALELARREFEPSSEGIGAGGKDRFEFIGLVGGETRIEMNYKRPWEEIGIKKKTFKIIIK